MRFQILKNWKDLKLILDIEMETIELADMETKLYEADWKEIYQLLYK
jgi:hypothetical protein